MIAEKLEELTKLYKDNISTINTRVTELEKRAAREPANDNYSYGSAANDNVIERAILGSTELGDLTSSFRGSATVKLTGEEVATITSGNSTVGAGRSAGTSLVPGHRVPGIVTPYERDPVVRDLIGKARTTSNSVEFAVETGFTNNARPVTEGTTKPTSDLTFNLKTAPVRTIAHIFKVSRQILDDVPALAAYIGQRGTYGLRKVEEEQILFGNGTGQNLNGIVPQATAFAPAFSSAHENPMDRVLQAISQAEDAEIPVNGVVLSKQDWRRIIGTKDQEGRYVSALSPFGLQDPRLWNVSVVPSNAMPVGQFLTGAFNDGAQIFDRMDVEVLLSTENDRDFEMNLCTVRIESRLALAVYRPEAFIEGDLYASATSGS